MGARGDPHAKKWSHEETGSNRISTMTVVAFTQFFDHSAQVNDLIEKMLKGRMQR
jgi:hypothetical protein